MAGISQDEVIWSKIVTDECRLRGYSDKTIKAYLFFVEKFLDSGKSAREFLLDMIAKGYREETLRLTGFAVKFYLKVSRKGDLDVEEIIDGVPNVKREKKLPVVLSKKEIELMILSCKNVNHRAMIMLGYAAGLRASEVVNLRWLDVDFKRNIIHIKRAKGKKDRIVMLSFKVKKTLKRLVQDDDKQGFVFRTRLGGKYIPKTFQVIIKTAAKKAGLKKKVTPHTLRHSFATHLLENGVDIRYIQELLGHAQLSTTTIYTKVAKRDILKVKSPLDMTRI
ncbi:MAG: tyrosine-type recombinase/integrase [archaeon]